MALKAETGRGAQVPEQTALRQATKNSHKKGEKFYNNKIFFKKKKSKFSLKSN